MFVYLIAAECKAEQHGDLRQEVLVMFDTWSLVYGLKPGKKERYSILHVGHWREDSLQGVLEEDKRFENTMNFGKNGIFEKLEWNWRIGEVWERLASTVCHWRIGQWRDALRTGIVCSDCMFACTKWYCNVSNMILYSFSKDWKQYREVNWEFKCVLARYIFE